MPLEPINWGGEVAPDNSGLNAQAQAISEQKQVFSEVHALGGVMEGGSTAVAQALLHTQAIKATAAVKERQASTLQFIDSNPYVPKAVLQQRMAPEDYTAWHAGLATEYQDKEAVPMFTAAGALFDSEAQQARQQAGSIISLPGWRQNWASTEQTESATIRERYVNRLAADQMISDQGSQSLMAIDKQFDSAVRPEDIQVGIDMAKNSPWLKPAARKFKMEQGGVLKDSFTADNFMKGHDVEGMENELVKLRSDNANELYPHMTEKQRLDLTNRLEREYSFYGAKAAADKLLVVGQGGKPDEVKTNINLAGYNGPNKPDVERQLKSQLNERKDIFASAQADKQSQLWTLGQDPRTGDFTMDRAQATAAGRKLADELNTDAPKLLTALRSQDFHAQRMADIADNEKAKAEKDKVAEAGKENLRSVYRVLDDETSSARYRTMTPQQFNSELLDINPPLPKPYMDAAMNYFKGFQQRGGKPDERPKAIVRSEISAAVNGDPGKTRKWLAKYEDNLTLDAHQWVRDNATMPPDKMSDGLKAFVKTKLLTASVLGGGRVFGDRDAKVVDWEYNPAYAGMDLKLPDGTLVGSENQMVKMSLGKESRWVHRGDQTDAESEGWVSDGR